MTCETCTLTMYVLTMYVLTVYVLTMYVLTMYVLIVYVLTMYVLTVYVLTMYVLTVYVLTVYVLTVYVLTVYVLTMYVLTVYVLTMYVLTMYVLTVYVWATHLLHAYCGWTAASEAPPCLTNRSRATLVTEPPRDSNYCCSTRSSHSAAIGRCPRWWRHLVATCPSCSLALGSRRVAATFRPAA